MRCCARAVCRSPMLRHYHIEHWPPQVGVDPVTTYGAGALVDSDGVPVVGWTWLRCLRLPLTWSFRFWLRRHRCSNAGSCTRSATPSIRSRLPDRCSPSGASPDTPHDLCNSSGVALIPRLRRRSVTILYIARAGLYLQTLSAAPQQMPKESCLIAVRSRWFCPAPARRQSPTVP